MRKQAAWISIFFTALAAMGQGSQGTSAKPGAGASSPSLQQKPAAAPAGPAATGQAAAPPTPPADPGAALPPDTPVITLDHACAPSFPESHSSGSECKTVFTKADFEKLVNSGRPSSAVPASTRATIVQNFTRFVILDEDALKQGLEKDPELQSALEAARIITIANTVQQRLSHKAQEVSQEQIDEYYKQHADEFQEVKAARIFIPKVAAGQTIDQAKAKALAEQLQKDAAAGKPLEDLEKQAYTELGLKQPPSTDMGAHRRNQFPAAQQEAIFALSPGQVTQVLEDPNAFYIYKAESKSTVAEANVSNEIKNDIAQKNFSEELKRIFEPVQVTLNPDYFNGMKTIDLNAGISGEADRRPMPSRTPQRPPQ
ncbi:MAG: peptidyl-prolyl cis-trans isomerase [Acidobacteria bacterium]|nr:peptidyl-prolyl cis-trans isomerase [Acidobacteriota bacterium]